MESQYEASLIIPAIVRIHAESDHSLVWGRGLIEAKGALACLDVSSVLCIFGRTSRDAHREHRTMSKVVVSLHEEDDEVDERDARPSFRCILEVVSWS